MSDRFPAPQPAEPRQGHRREASAAVDLTAGRALRSRIRRLSALPAVTVLGILVAAQAAHRILGSPMWWSLPVAALGGAVAILGDRRAASTAHDVQEAAARQNRERVHEEVRRRRAEDHQQVVRWIEHLHASVVGDHQALLGCVEQLERGEAPSIPTRTLTDHLPGDPFAGFSAALARMQSETLEAVVALAARQRAAASEAEQAEVFIYIAQRLHALVSRTLAALTAMENGIEDPDLLLGLFGIDHLVTRTRRTVESLAVLGGQTPRRVIAPLLLSTVLRQAVAEIEQYPRVRVQFPRQEVALPGHAGPDVIHLLAELVENGTKFSPESTHVVMQAEPVPAGVVIDIQDRGLSVSPERMAQLNRLLAAPEEIDLREQLKGGHIGLLVTARLAHRHGVRVELRRNVLGGTQALVVLPHHLLVPVAEGRPSVDRAAEPAAAPVAADASTLPSPPPSDGAGPQPHAHPGPAGGSGSALPQRRSRTAAVPSDSVRTPAPVPVSQESPPDGRPLLPRRSDARSKVAPPAGDRTTSPSHPASAGLMASYSAGVRSANSEAPPDDATR